MSRCDTCGSLFPKSQLAKAAEALRRAGADVPSESNRACPRCLPVRLKVFKESRRLKKVKAVNGADLASATKP